MTVHVPKKITSSQGLGLNTTKQMHYLTQAIAIGTETWGRLEKPWQESGTIIAQEDYMWRTRWEVCKPYIVTKFYDASNREVGIYCDIAWPVQQVADGFMLDDLYLDVWQPAGKKPVLLDEDELAEALLAGFVTQDEANSAYLAARELLAILGSGTFQLDSLNS